MKSREKMQHVSVFGHEVKVEIKGKGEKPLLIVGPATLFSKRKELLPENMRKLFTIYFIDIFSKAIKLTEDEINEFELSDFVTAIDVIRKQLELAEISLFAHSAMGVLGHAYTNEHSDRVTSLIMIATAPIWSKYKTSASDLFFEKNANKERTKLYEEDGKAFRKKKDLNKRDEFIEKYISRRARFFYNPKHPLASGEMWENVNHNMALVSRYFELIQDYVVKSISTSTFLGLGLYDSSSPFFLWTDNSKEILKKIHYHIFEESGHYPMMEQKEEFITELQKFMESIKLKSSESSEDSKQLLKGKAS